MQRSTKRIREASGAGDSEEGKLDIVKAFESIEGDGKTLSIKDKAFCYYYVTHWNAERAAREAGFTSPTYSSRMVLRKPYVKAFLEEICKQLAATADECVARVSDIARGNITEFMDSNGRISLKVIKDSPYSFLIKSITSGKDGVKIQLHDALEAQRLLLIMAKRLGHFNGSGEIDDELKMRAIQLAKKELDLQRREAQLEHKGMA